MDEGLENTFGAPASGPFFGKRFARLATTRLSRGMGFIEQSLDYMALRDGEFLFFKPIPRSKGGIDIDLRYGGKHSAGDFGKGWLRMMGLLRGGVVAVGV